MTIRGRVILFDAGSIFREGMTPMLRAETTAWPSARSNTTAHEHVDPIEKIEAWVASNLDSSDGSGDGNDDWHRRAVEILNPRRVKPDPSRDALGVAAGWTRISVAKRPGATIVRLKDKSLVKESHLHELSEELADLILAGHRRLALDFGNVERMSCQMLPVLARALRLCGEEGGGMVKVFNLRPELAPVVGLSPLTSSFPIPPDESTAVGGPWPESGPRPLPEALLAGLNSLKRKAEAASMPQGQTTELGEDASDVADLLASTDSRVPCLVVAEGRSAGAKLLIGEQGVLIGRDAACRVRSDHAFLSRRHARLRSKGGRAWVHDLGSTNGSILNGKPLGPEEVEVFAGDRLVIGPFKFTISIANTRRSSINDAEIVGWLGSESGDESGHESPSEVTAYDVPSTSRPLRIEVIEDVLMVTPLDPNLLQTSDPVLIRDELNALIENHRSRKVVMNLEHAGRLSNATLGVLVAYHLRLDQLGGALRLCEPHIRIAQFLDQIRLPILLDVFTTKEEAVLSSWDRPAGSAQ